jgi:uncharacterized protein (TIGR03643 family)
LRAPSSPKLAAPAVDPRRLGAAILSEVIEMALSDHVTFGQIRAQHGLSPDQVKEVMRMHLKPGSYRAWRRRIQAFGERRERYK